MGHTAWCAVDAQGFTMHYVTNMRLQKKRASEWVQFYLDPISIRAQTVTAQDVVGEEREGVHIEQSAAEEWIKAQGWECIADELQNGNLLQHDIVHNGVRVPWGEGFRQWGVLLGRFANLVWEKGFLTATKVNELRADLKVMGALHRALGLSISLWPHLWVDHMVEVVVWWNGGLERDDHGGGASAIPTHGTSANPGGQPRRLDTQL